MCYLSLLPSTLLLVFHLPNKTERWVAWWLHFCLGNENHVLNCKILRCKGLHLLLFSFFLRLCLTQSLAYMQSYINICCMKLMDGKSSKLSKVTHWEVMARPGQDSSDFQIFPLDKWRPTVQFFSKRVSSGKIKMFMCHSFPIKMKIALLSLKEKYISSRRITYFCSRKVPMRNISSSFSIPKC